MKKLLFLLFIIPFFAFSQEYTEIVEIPGKTIDQLYSTAREWFAVTYNSATDVLKMDDPVAGKLIGKGSTHLSDSYIAGSGLAQIPIMTNWYPNYTINLSFKDGKYKCDITDVVISINVPGGPVGAAETPFSSLFEKKDYYKNGSDPNWIVKNPPLNQKIGKSMAKTLAATNASTLKLINETDDHLKSIQISLKKYMSKSDDNW